MSNVIKNFTEIFKRLSTEYLNTVYPCEVIKYEKGMADIKIKVNRVYEDKNIEFPVLFDIPVLFPFGKDYSITYPIKSGDVGIYIVSKANLGNWLNNGKNATLDSNNAFSLEYGFCIIGMAYNSDIDENILSIKYKDNSIVFNDDEVNINDGNLVIKKG